MLRTHRYITDPLLFAAAWTVAVFCAVMLWVMIRIERPGSALVFAVIGLIFLAVGLFYSTIVTISPQGVRRTLLNLTVWEASWAEMGEVGICGTRILRDPKSQRVGTLYLYFSKKPMTEQERYAMVLKWPPMKQCFLRFRYDRMREVQLLWTSRIVEYNAGDFSFGEGLKN